MSIDNHPALRYTDREVMTLAKRKTFTSYEVKKRWMDQNYKRYNINLRLDTDQDLIQYIEDHKDKEGTTEIFRSALEQYIKGEQH